MTKNAPSGGDSSDENNSMKDNGATPNGKTDEPSKPDSGFKNYFRLFTYTDRIGWILNIISFSASIAAGVTLPLMSVIFGSGISDVNSFASSSAAAEKFRNSIIHNVLWFIYLFIARLVLVYIGTLCISISAIRTTRALREAYLEKMLRREIWHFDSQVAGSIAIQVTTNAARVNKGIADQLSVCVQALATFFAAFIVAIAVQWKLALITLSVIPAMFLITAGCVALDARLESKVIRVYSEAGKVAEEVFSSIRTVKAFWAQSKKIQEYDAHLDEARRLGLKKTPIWGVFISNQYFCIYSGIALAFWQGFKMYQNGEISGAGKVFTVILSVLIASSSISAILPQFENLSRATASASELFEALDQPSKLDPFDATGHQPTTCNGNIEVRDLEFAYPSRPQAKILKGLSLSIPAGKTTALVGASGCGKSTLVGLLERWYERSAGHIELDGIDINDINTKWLRSQMRLVQQEPVLFSGTVFKNVANGFLDSQRELPVEKQMELVKQACEASFASEFIEQLPKGYHTELGERGGTLSGGQRQRIAIARSIVSDPRILLLDEATSALDPKAENIVQEALNNVSASRTTLVIAHKLATIRNADNIAVIAEGHVAEQGSHDELMKSDGLYAKLVTAQDLGDGEQSDEEKLESEKTIFADEKVKELSREQSQAQSQAAEKDEIVVNKIKRSVNYSLLKVLWVIFREQKELYPYIFVSICACVVGGATYPGQAVLFSQVLPIFNLTGSEASSKADFYALMFFVVAIGNCFAYIIIGVNCNIISQKATHYYRHELYTNLLKQDTEFYDDPENTTGALTSMLSSLPNQLQELIAANIFLMVIIVVTVVASSILAIIYGYALGLLLVFAGLPPLLLAGWGRIKLEMLLEEKNSERFSASAGLANEAISSIKTVSSLTLEPHIISDFSDILQDVVKNSISSLLWTIFWYALSQALELLIMALGLWYGSRLLLNGTYSIHQFYVIFIGVLFAGQNAAQFFGYTTSITRAQSAANYMFWLRAQTPIVQENDSNRDSGPDSDDGSVELSSLTFRYPSRKTPALDNISIKIESGQFAAFVGPSGCGKSTMINLLERFYDPTSGEVKVGSKNIANYSPRLYRQNVSLVQQEPTLFSGTIRENIMLGLEANEERAEGEKLEARIIEACKQANAYEFIESLPEGLSTPCGNRGLQFSGGQKQRIAIARALIRQPRLLLLDEATSALDTKSERVVQAALDQVKEGRTTIAVAHRLSTIKHADVIFVFGNGRIAEQGTHAELLAKKGRYYEMCISQSMDRTG